MDHHKRNKVLGIITLVFAMIGIIGSVSVSAAGSARSYSAEFKLSPSGYIEYDFGDTTLVDFTATISLTAADAYYDGITAYLVHDDITTADGPYARGYQAYTYSSISSLATGYTIYYGYSSSIHFYKSSIYNYYTSYVDDNYRIVVVPAVNHDFNAQNVTVSISVTTTARGSGASYMITYTVMLAIPAVLLAISAIVTANAAAPTIQPRPQYVYTPVPQSPSIQKPAPPSDKRFCPACASEIQAGQRFCHKCGAAL
jgi:hypothetical protein